MADAQRLKKAFEQAAEIAKAVPGSMHDAAFNRALDEILGEGSSADKPRRRRPSEGSKPRPKRETGPEAKQDRQAVLGAIDRTEHPGIDDSASVQDRSLRVLAAAQDLGIDGLTAGEISKVLTEKFRVSTSRRGVAMALDAAGRFVNRDKEGNKVIYRIMAAGRRHLDSDGETEGPERGQPKRAKKPKAARKGKSTTSASEKASSAKSGGRTQRKRAGRPGPKAAISQLIEAGFFSEARTIADIRNRLEAKRGYVFKPTDLSPALNRLLREDKLDRERNEDGNYEYSAK